MSLLRNSWFALAMNQVGWFACVLGAASGRPWLGPATVATWCALYVVAARDRARTLALLALVGAWGFALDAALVVGRFFRFTGAPTVASPTTPWMVALWVLFATTLRGPMRKVLARPWLAALVGAFVGPLAYGGGVRLGAAAFGPSPLASRAVIAIGWAITLPALGALERWLSPPAEGRT